MLYQDFLTNDKKVIHKWLHYFPVYEKHFQRFVNQSAVIWEIGVFRGGSLQMWKRYFGPFAQIIGLDINPECKRHEEDQINVCIGDQSDTAFLQKVLDEYGTPDIVIDDGSHEMKDIFATFNYMYDKLSKNGVYLVEDLHTAYMEEYGGGLQKEGTFIEGCKMLVDFLNARHCGLDTDFADSTFSICFYDSVVVFEKMLWRKGACKDMMVPDELNYAARQTEITKQDSTEAEHGVIIQKLLDTFTEKHYLEIGVSDGVNFAAIKADYKVGVDPIEPSPLVKQIVNDKCIYHSMKSDDFFNNVIGKDDIFDVIFIDGLHEYKQAYRDITKALRHLAKDGIIVVHDCKPYSEVVGLPPHLYEKASFESKKTTNFNWTGDVWKAIVMLRSKFDDLHVFTLDCDFGCAVISRGAPEEILSFEMSDIMTMNFSDLEKDGTRLLNLKHPDYLDKFIEERNGK